MQNDRKRIGDTFEQLLTHAAALFVRELVGSMQRTGRMPGKKLGAPLTGKRTEEEMRCRALLGNGHQCPNRSRGPRNRYMCVDHKKELTVAQQRAALAAFHARQNGHSHAGAPA